MELIETSRLLQYKSTSRQSKEPNNIQDKVLKILKMNKEESGKEDKEDRSLLGSSRMQRKLKFDFSQDKRIRVDENRKGPVIIASNMKSCSLSAISNGIL